MSVFSRPLISHLMVLAAGFLLGILVVRHSETTLKVAEPAAAPVETEAPETPAAPEPEIGTTEPQPAADVALLKMRSDYEEQIRKGEQRQALLILQELEKKAPKSQIYMEMNSDYQIYTRDWQAAAAAANACVAAFPKSRLCFRNLATAELQDGSTDEQAAAVQSCLALEPNDPQCRNMLGMVQMNGGDFNGAVTTYEKLIRDNGSYGTRFDDDHLEWQLGLALEGAGRREEALDHLENACRRNNNQACEKIEELSGGGID
jgi:tetratricopeptide (TPR) repeat protein